MVIFKRKIIFQIVVKKGGFITEEIIIFYLFYTYSKWETS